MSGAVSGPTLGSQMGFREPRFSLGTLFLPTRSQTAHFISDASNRANVGKRRLSCLSTQVISYYTFASMPRYPSTFFTRDETTQCFAGGATVLCCTLQDNDHGARDRVKVHVNPNETMT